MNDNLVTVAGDQPRRSDGQVQAPLQSAPARVFGYTLKPGTHLRHQGITQLPKASFSRSSIRPTLVPGYNSMLSPNGVDMLTADEERDLLNVPVPLAPELTVPGMHAMGAERALANASIVAVDLKFPTWGTAEQSVTSIYCTGEGFPKCPYCRPKSDPTPPKLPQAGTPGVPQ